MYAYNDFEDEWFNVTLVKCCIVLQLLLQKCHLTPSNARTYTSRSQFDLSADGAGNIHGVSEAGLTTLQ